MRLASAPPATSFASECVSVSAGNCELTYSGLNSNGHPLFAVVLGADGARRTAAAAAAATRTGSPPASIRTTARHTQLLRSSQLFRRRHRRPPPPPPPAPPSFPSLLHLFLRTNVPGPLLLPPPAASDDGTKPRPTSHFGTCLLPSSPPSFHAAAASAESGRAVDSAAAGEAAADWDIKNPFLLRGSMQRWRMRRRRRRRPRGLQVRKTQFPIGQRLHLARQGG